MFNAEKRLSEVESSSRHNADSIKTLQRELLLLQSSTDTLIENLRSEWRQYLASIEDERDKMEHIVKRHAKRRSRAKAEEVDQPVDNQDTVAPAQDPTTAKVMARRNKHAIRT